MSLYIKILSLIYFWYSRLVKVGRGSSAGIATLYVLDGLGIESRWRRDIPHSFTPALGPTRTPIEWVSGGSQGVVLATHPSLAPRLPLLWAFVGSSRVKFTFYSWHFEKFRNCNTRFTLQVCINISGFSGLEVACCPLVLKFAGSNPAEAVGFFQGEKNPQHALLRKRSKVVFPMS